MANTWDDSVNIASGTPTGKPNGGADLTAANKGQPGQSSIPKMPKVKSVENIGRPRGLARLGMGIGRKSMLKKG